MHKPQLGDDRPDCGGVPFKTPRHRQVMPNLKTKAKRQISQWPKSQTPGVPIQSAKGHFLQKTLVKYFTMMQFRARFAAGPPMRIYGWEYRGGA